MSDERWSSDGVIVTTFAGPVSESEPDRRRIQIWAGGLFITLTMREWWSLRRFALLGGVNPYRMPRIDDDQGTVPSDNELPGMWSASDFTGGADNG
jgi:hypothetical protein